MSHLSNRRALLQVEKACEAQHWDIAEIVRESYCLEASNGTHEEQVLSPEARLGNYRGEKTPQARPAPTPAAQPSPKQPSSEQPSRSGGRRVWTKDVRPGPHDILTWEEILDIPWIDGTDDEEPQ
jgi:hypothetical protein